MRESLYNKNVKQEHNNNIYDYKNSFGSNIHKQEKSGCSIVS